MQFSIVWVSLALVLGFAFGFAISFLCDRAMMKHWRNEAARNFAALQDLIGSCRNVLADSWYNRVMRNWRWCYGGGRKEARNERTQ